MAQTNARPVLIAGGGIGGLAAALGLAQKGISSILLEKASALGEIGAGIQLGPNAFHAFDAAHPMLQYFSQGACQTMEDAMCLSHMLDSHPDDHVTALEKYRQQRFPRTARVASVRRAPERPFCQGRHREH